MTETEALAAFMETHLDDVDQIKKLVEHLLITRGLPAGLVSSMLIGGGVGMLIEGGVPAQEVRDHATNAVETTIRNLQARARA
jgi:hypothetical protein